MKFFHFLTYNNAVPIAISLVLVGGTATFAATDPQAILDSQQTVLSVDNTYLVNKDLANYSPKAVITSVSEDEDTYYVDYTLSTIDISDAVWKDTSRTENITVAKAQLGQYRDLGVYVTQQLHDIVARELQRLVDTQKDESKHVSQKVVATEYSGLIGKFLDTSTETLPGYTPIVQPPPPPVEETASAGASTGSSSGDTSSSQGSAPPSTSNNSSMIQILGNNPANLNVGDRYADLGAVVTDPAIAAKAGIIQDYLNGNPVEAISIDTSSPGTWTIRYVATADGQSWSAERTVIVTNPFASQQAAPPATTTPDTPPTDTNPPSSDAASSTSP